MDTIKGIFSYIGGAIALVALVTGITFVLSIFNIVSSQTLDIVVFTIIGIVLSPIALCILAGIGMGIWYIISLFPSVKNKKHLKHTITCTKSGTKINYYPMVVCEDLHCYYYLKCRSQKKWKCKKKKQLEGEEVITKAINKRDIKHSFLLHNNYVDTTTLFMMGKNSFVDACQYNQINYALINDNHIKHAEKTKITEHLTANLIGEKPKYCFDLVCLYK